MQPLAFNAAAQVAAGCVWGVRISMPEASLRCVRHKAPRGVRFASCVHEACHRIGLIDTGAIATVWESPQLLRTLQFIGSPRPWGRQSPKTWGARVHHIFAVYTGEHRRYMYRYRHRYMYMFSCTCTCAHICICAVMYSCLHVDICISIDIHKYMYVRLYMSAIVHRRAEACLHVCAEVSACMYKSTRCKLAQDPTCPTTRRQH